MSEHHPIVGVWEVVADGAPFGYHVMTFHPGGTMLRSNPDGGNRITSDSSGMGVWRADTTVVIGKFLEITVDRDDPELVDSGVVHFELAVEAKSLTATFYDLSGGIRKGPSKAKVTGRKFVLDSDEETFPLPRDIPPEVAVQFNPLGAGFAWAVNVPQTRPGDEVVILGCGQRGLASLPAAREAGARRVIMTGLARDAFKLALARELGADTTIDVEADDPVAIVRDITGGAGARVVVDTTPRAPGAVTDAVEMAAQGGTVVLAGIKGTREVPGLFSDRIITKELTIKGVLGVDYTSLEQAVPLIESGKYPLNRIHTHSFDIGEAAQALKTLSGEIPGEEAIHLAIVPVKRQVAGQVTSSRSVPRKKRLPR